MAARGDRQHEERAAHPTLTYRQTERTFGLLIDLLAADAVPGWPSTSLALIVDQLIEASIPELYKHASTALAIDWTDIETWATPPPKGSTGADPDASWGHRNGGPTTTDLFYGYYAQAATMVSEEHGPPVPELARRLLLTSCHIDPPRAFVAVLQRMHHAAIILGDLISDSGYAHRLATAWALPLRQLGARLVTDLHPADRGPKGTYAGAIIANGNLYCPLTPPALLDIAPSPAAPIPPPPPPMTPPPAKPPATNSDRSAPTTATDTTGSAARPAAANSAARSNPNP